MVNEPSPGPQLVLVATPIGNLEDMSVRAIAELSSADLILCEDTRHSAVLLRRYNIERPTASYNAHTARSKVPWVMTQLRAGKRVAVISDAGTPGISDPGALLVRAALDEGFAVGAVPGASAILTALVLSGLRTDRFAFEGFLPHKKGRQTRLRELAGEPRTIVLYESPYRVVKTLTELREHLGDRPAAVCRELTKVFEEVRRGALGELLAHFTATAPRGEFVIVVAGTDYRNRISEEQSEGI